MKASQFRILEKPRLVSLTFNISNKFGFDGPVDIDAKTNVEVIKNPDSQTEAIVVLNISLFEDRTTENAPFKLNLKIGAAFEWDDELVSNDEILNGMLSQNAPAILLGYARPIISGITVDANLPPLVLPLINFIDNDECNEEASE